MNFELHSFEKCAKQNLTCPNQIYVMDPCIMLASPYINMQCILIKQTVAKIVNEQYIIFKQNRKESLYIGFPKVIICRC